MPKFFQPEDYILSRIAAYPSLYGSNSYDESRIKVLDQLLNVIGNGIRDDEELADDLKAFTYDRERAVKAYSGEPVYYGYYQTRELIPGCFIGEGDSISVLESEKDAQPDIVYWMQAKDTNFRAERLGIKNTWKPYPNFDKKYSTLYTTNIRDYGPEWQTEILWFYTKCLEYFNGDCSNYHSAFPNQTIHQTQQSIDSIKKFTEKYATFEEITEAYGVEFKGDYGQFLVDRWAKEKTKIFEFINNTISELSA